MNCYKGICKHRTDNNELCTKDIEKGIQPQKCDMKHEPQYNDVCRYGFVGCKQCYAYDICKEI